MKTLIIILLSIIAIVSMIAIFACAFAGISGYLGNHADLFMAFFSFCTMFVLSIICLESFAL